MKKILKMSFWVAVVALLVACGRIGTNTDTTGTNGKSAKYTTTGTSDSDSYEGVIKDGVYQTSKARGLTLGQNTQGGNSFNIRSLEDGLVKLSKTQFSTSDYLFSEGQVLTRDAALKWLGRESKSNPLGLNPEDNKKTDPDKRNPIYLQSILEQDYLQKSGGDMRIGGVSIGLALNEYDYYQKEKYGATYTTTISDDDIKKQGEEMAQKVVERLRKEKGIANDTPILVALYKNASRDSLVGGTMIEYVVSKSGNKLGKFTAVNEINEVLPVIDGKKAVNENVAESFKNFSSAIEGFFPTLAGVTAQAHYEDNKLTGLNITINTQFYGQTEIESFAQTVAANGDKYLPSGVKIEVTVQATTGTQAFLARDANEKNFYIHVFGSY